MTCPDCNRKLDGENCPAGGVHDLKCTHCEEPATEHLCSFHKEQVENKVREEARKQWEADLKTFFGQFR